MLRLLCAAAVIVAAIPATVLAQPGSFAEWIFYPTPGVPRTADGKVDISAPTPRAADGKPDLSGMWGWETRTNCGARCTDLEISPEFINIAASLETALPYRPGVADLVRQRTAAQHLDPNARCMPRGAPRIWTDDYYKRILQFDDRLIILTERNMQYRQIFTDGRPLPEDPNPTWNGYSTGRWEGDTLLVQTAGFRDDLWLDARGNPLTTVGKLTERIRRPDYGTLEVEMTIDDPQSYTAPWTVTLRQPLVVDSELLDYYCLENEQSLLYMPK